MDILTLDSKNALSLCSIVLHALLWQRKKFEI
jgi:hypothetical protein